MISYYVMWLKVREMKSNIYKFITSRHLVGSLKQKIWAILKNTNFYLLQAFREEKLLKSDNTGSV